MKERRGRRPISQEVIQRITNHALSDEMSRPAANRTVKGRSNEEQVPVRYKNCSDVKSYAKYKQTELAAQRKPCSPATFKNILKTIKNLKKSKKATDMCEICVEGKQSQ